MKAPATRNTMTPAPAFDPAYFGQFVEWIDRSERTARAYIGNLRQFWAFLLFTGARQPQRADVVAFRDYLAREHEAIKLDAESPQGWTYRTDATGAPILATCKPNTIRAYLRSVSQFFAWTEAAGLYPNIAANVHGPKVRQDAHKKDALQPSEVLEIERSIKARAAVKEAQAGEQEKDTAGRVQRSEEQGARLFALYLLAVNAGLRTIELSRANVKDLQEKHGQYYLYVFGKGHTEADQVKALAPEVAEAVKAYLNTRADKYNGNSPLFVATGNRSGGRRLAATTISTMLKQAMKDAGYNSDRLTAHSLRHTAGTAAMEATGDLYAVQKYMRHADPKTTEIYLHVDTEKQDADTARRLYELYHAQP